MNDLVSYNEKHNEANGEDNNDGHNDNRSCNYGEEGPTENQDIVAVRERQKRNFLTTLLFSHGTPMLLAGDEFGRSQQGNNNGYCQDSEISWVNWEALSDQDHALRHFTQRLVALRAEQPLLRRESWRDGLEIRWFNAGGGLQQSEQWDEGSTLGLAISRPDLEQEEGIWHDVLMLFNPFEGDVPFQIPQFGEGGWVLELSTAEEKRTASSLPRQLILFWPGAAFALSDGLKASDKPGVECRVYIVIIDAAADHWRQGWIHAWLQKVLDEQRSSIRDSHLWPPDDARYQNPGSVQ